MKKIYIISICLIALNLGGILSQKELSLTNAIQIGLQNNYQIQISDKNVNIAENNNNWGQTGILPTISANLVPSFNSSDFIDNSVIENSTLRWSFFNGFKAIITKDNLKKLEEISYGNSAIIVENTIQAIITTYYDALLQKEKLDVFSDLKNLSRDRYNYMKNRQELGAAVTYEVLQAQNAFLSDSSNFLIQELNFRNSIRNLNLLLAEPPETKYTFTNNFDVEPSEFIYDSLQGQLMSSNKTLVNQYINQEILKNNIKLAKSSIFPSLSLSTGNQYTFGDVVYNGMPIANDQRNNFYLNFTLAVTLYNGGRITTAIKNAKIEEQIGQLTLYELHHQMKNALFNAYSFFEIRKQLLNVANEQLKTAKLNLQLSQERYQLGSINSFNYRDVQTIYLNAALSKLHAIYNIIETESELLRLTGAILKDQSLD